MAILRPGKFSTFKFLGYAVPDISQLLAMHFYTMPLLIRSKSRLIFMWAIALYSTCNSPVDHGVGTVWSPNISEGGPAPP